MIPAGYDLVCLCRTHAATGRGGLGGLDGAQTVSPVRSPHLEAMGITQWVVRTPQQPEERTRREAIPEPLLLLAHPLTSEDEGFLQLIFSTIGLELNRVMRMELVRLVEQQPGSRPQRGLQIGGGDLRQGAGWLYLPSFEQLRRQPEYKRQVWEWLKEMHAHGRGG